MLRVQLDDRFAYKPGQAAQIGPAAGSVLVPYSMASAPEDMHDLPLRALPAALAEQGIRAHLLGARTPLDALTDAVRRLGPPVVVLWAQMPLAELPVLPTLRPAPALVVGGPGLGTLAESRVRAHSLSEALDQVRAAIGL